MRMIFCRGDRCPQVCPPPIGAEPQIPSTSPARLLAASLTDPETRGEWAREYVSGMGLGFGFQKYENKTRKITITRGGYGEGYLNTPFTLTPAEQKIVHAALDGFEKWGKAQREAEALSRLTASVGKRKQVA